MFILQRIPSRMEKIMLIYEEQTTNLSPTTPTVFPNSLGVRRVLPSGTSFQPVPEAPSAPSPPRGWRFSLDPGSGCSCFRQGPELTELCWTSGGCGCPTPAHVTEAGSPA